MGRGNGHMERAESGSLNAQATQQKLQKLGNFLSSFSTVLFISFSNF
jgi:hypothetical protein